MAKSLTEVAERLGYKGSGTNTTMLIRQRLNELGISELIQKFAPGNKKSNIRKKLEQISKEELLEIISTSQTITECFNKLYVERDTSKPYTGKEFSYFKQVAQKHKIDISHFNQYNGIKNFVSSQRADIATYFTKNNPHGTTALKRIVIREKLIPYVCSSCGLTNKWNGKELSLQLHHKDGDKTNNELTNLTFLCPNCHSQTDSYSGKNI